MRTLCAVLLATVVAASSSNVGAALIVVKVAGYDPISVPIFEQPAGPGNSIFRAGTPELPFFQLQTDDWSVALWAELDPDPGISYGLFATNLAAVPTTFGFTFLTPIVPVIGPSFVTASVGGSLTDGGNGSVSVTPVAPVGIPQDGPDVGALPDELQVATVRELAPDGPYTNIGLDLGPALAAVVPPFSTIPYPTLNVGPASGPVSATGWDELRIDVNFTLSPGDSFGATGSSTIDIIPELSSYVAWCLLSGFGVAVCWYRRRRNAD
jgi:hypothetical protein